LYRYNWEGEAELWESMLETYNLLLAPGALRGAAEPGWYLMVRRAEFKPNQPLKPTNVIVPPPPPPP
jgi:hypothetical protein